MLPVVILSGGLASRLKPISDSIPKSLIEINKKPFLEWQLQFLEKNGCKQVVLCVAHLSSSIENYIQSRPKSQIEINFSNDGAKQLGTGGAIVKARKLLSSEFLVLYGDSYLPINFNEVSDFFLQSNKLGLMTVKKNDLGYEQSNVIFENGMVKAYRKNIPDPNMKFIDFGLNAFKSSVFDDLNADQYIDLSTIQANLATRNELIGYEVHENYYEVGSFSGIKDFENYTKGF